MFMTQTSEIVSGFSTEDFNTFLQSRNEPAWLQEARRQAWEVCERLPMPSRNDEEWRRTDIRLFHLDRFSLPQTSSQDVNVPPGLLVAGISLAGRAVSLNSQNVLCELNPKYAKLGVLFGNLDEMVSEHGELIRPHLMTNAWKTDYDKFSALHAAAWSGGTLLYVPKGVVVDEPLHILSALDDGQADFGHTLVILEEGAEATLLAETDSLNADCTGLHVGGVELLVGQGASLRYVNLQNWAKKVWHFAHQKAVVQRDGRLQWTIGALGARLAKVNQHVSLVGEGADAQVNGVMFTEGKQHMCYNTLQHHQAPNTRSDLLYKDAMQDHSQLVWRGMIKVDREAQQTNGYQRNDNLLLSEHARADSIPGLEIEADDVRCTHGATAGRVDDEQVFYCRCRGLTRQEAIRMIVAGFFQQVFDRITIESVRDALGQVIGRRIREYD